MREVSFIINGNSVKVEVDERELLIHTIREKLNLTGAHIGCETSHCGACTVDINGQSIKSCTYLTVQAEDKEIWTVEGLAKNGELSAVQEGFMQEHGLQCGYCTPGMLMRSWRMLQDDVNISEEDIRTEISGNLCRCTGYQNIVKAISYASNKIKAKELTT